MQPDKNERENKSFRIKKEHKMLVTDNLSFLLVGLRSLATAVHRILVVIVTNFIAVRLAVLDVYLFDDSDWSEDVALNALLHVIGNQQLACVTMPQHGVVRRQGCIPRHLLRFGIVIIYVLLFGVEELMPLLGRIFVWAMNCVVHAAAFVTLFSFHWARRWIMPNLAALVATPHNVNLWIAMRIANDSRAVFGPVVLLTLMAFKSCGAGRRRLCSAASAAAVATAPPVRLRRSSVSFTWPFFADDHLFPLSFLVAKVKKKKRQNHMLQVVEIRDEV
jgi:hypothetical protein